MAADYLTALTVALNIPAFVPLKEDVDACANRPTVVRDDGAAALKGREGNMSPHPEEANGAEGPAVDDTVEPVSIFEADVPVLDLREALDTHARRRIIEGMRRRRRRPLWIALGLLVAGAITVAVLWLAGVFNDEVAASGVLVPLLMQRSRAIWTVGGPLAGDTGSGASRGSGNRVEGKLVER